MRMPYLGRGMLNAITRAIRPRPVFVLDRAPGGVPMAGGCGDVAGHREGADRNGDNRLDLYRAGRGSVDHM